MSWLSVAGSVIGSGLNFMGGRSAQQSSNAQNAYQYQMDRDRFKRDRAHSERYEQANKRNDRAYVDRQIRDQRQYDRSQTVDERRYERQQYNQTVADDRRYLEQNRKRDQRALNEAERRSVDTRGVDWQKMRDDAIAAGFNPLSVMGTAGMYSTEVNRQVVGAGGLSGGVGTGRATPGSGGGGGGGGSFGGGGTTGAASVGMVGPSGGNSRSFDPSLTSGAFLGDAIQRGIDTVFNQPVENDPLADALRKALQTDNVVADHRSKDYRQSFGYDLQSQDAYRPPVNVSGPPMSRGTSAQAAQRSGSDDMTPTSTLPLTIDGRQLQSTGRHSDAEAFESRYGELAGEVAGISALTDDLGEAARNRSMVNYGKPVKVYRKPKLYDWPRGLRPDGYGGFQ